MKKFWYKVEDAFKKLFGSTTWEKTASSVLTYLAPLLETLVALTAGGPAAALATGIVDTLQSDLATVAAVVNGANATPPANELAAVIQALESIETKLAALLTAAEIKNSTNAAKITAVVNTIVGEVEAILENIPKAAATKTA
jgi:hypothetical protein